MKRIRIYIILFFIVVLFRENIAFFYGNVLGVFKLDNKYYEGIIRLKDERIEYLENEYKNFNEFSNNIKLLTYNYKISKVLYKDSYNTTNYKIQFGKKDNIIKGMGVTNEYGLVGVITEVNDISSSITILKELKDINVLVNNTYGKLNYDYELNVYIIEDISNYDKVYINDKVYTSGYGTIKEKLYVGKVIKVENDDISKKIYVKSDVDFNNLNYLLIVGDI